VTVTLEQLAARINAREEAAGKSTLEHARAQGLDLIEVRRRLGKRKFAPWLRNHFPYGKTTAYQYIKVAENWDAIGSTGERMGLKEAVRRIDSLVVGEEEGESKPVRVLAPVTTPETSTADKPTVVTVRQPEPGANGDARAAAAEEEEQEDGSDRDAPSTDHTRPYRIDLTLADYEPYDQMVQAAMKATGLGKGRVHINAMTDYLLKVSEVSQ
jgi:hypothetical protein